MKRALFYAGLILAAFMLQNNLFAASALIHTVPNILLIITFSFGFIRGKMDGMLLGFFSGLLSDLFFGTSIGYYALIYMLIGYGNGLLGQAFYTEFVNMPVILCILSEILFSLYVYVFSFLMKGQTNIVFYIQKVVLPETAYTVLLTLIIYKFLLWMNTKITGLEKRSAKKFV